MAESSGERATETPNTIYNLSSVLFHALKGGANYNIYIEDAEDAGDEELADFFRRVRDEDSMRADEAQRLLAARTPSDDGGAEGTAATPTAEGAASASRRTEPSSPPPGAAEELRPTRAGEASSSTVGVTSSTEPASAPPGEGDVSLRRTEEDSVSRPEPSTDLPGIDPIAEGTPSGDVRRESDLTGRPEVDLSTPGEEVPTNASRSGGVPPRRMEEVPPPRPEPSDDFPGTEPLREDASAARAGEVPPPPEEIPPERAGGIPTAEEIPPPRAEELPGAEETPSGTSPQAPSGNVTPPVPGEIPHEGMVPPTPPPPRETPGDVQSGISPETSPTTEEALRAEEERAMREEREEDKGLVDRTKDYLLGEGRESDYLRGEDRARKTERGRGSSGSE